MKLAICAHMRHGKECICMYGSVFVWMCVCLYRCVCLCVCMYYVQSIYSKYIHTQYIVHIYGHKYIKI